MQSLEPTERCQTCGKQTAKSESVSLTQWIFGGGSCCCETIKEKVEKSVEVHICDACRKPRYVGTRHGSITQWVLRSYACSCSSFVSSSPAPQQELIELLRQTLVPESRVKMEDENFPAFDTNLQQMLGMGEDRYIALEALGHGNSAQVFSCYDKYLRKRVALKTLAMPHWSEHRILHFQQEAKILSKLSHPNIVGILDLGITERQQPYMVMDLIDGVPLSKLIECSGYLSVASVTALVNNACQGLQYAHERGILHCDIAPHNMMCRQTEEGDFSLQFIDFGLSRIVSGEGEILESTDRLAGNPLFMCPDTLLGRQYDERSEVYSLACVVFFALTGKPPFLPVGSALLTSSQHANRTLPALSEVRPESNVPEAVELVVRRALSKAPEDRYMCVADFQDAWNNAAAESASPPANTKIMGELRNIARSKNTYIFVFGAAVIFVGIIVGIFATSRELASQKTEKTYSTKLEKVDLDENWNRAGAIFNEHFIPAYDTIPSEDLSKVRQANSSMLITEPELILVDTDVNDADLKILKKCRMLGELDLSGTRITERAIDDISRVKSLKRLYLSRIPLSARSLAELSRIPALEELRLDHCRLGDAEVQSISKIKSLRILRIDGNPAVTDAGARYLCNLPRLSSLAVSGTGISASGLQMLKRNRGGQTRCFEQSFGGVK